LKQLITIRYNQKTKESLGEEISIAGNLEYLHLEGRGFRAEISLPRNLALPGNLNKLVLKNISIPDAVIVQSCTIEIDIDSK
jgi:hypothetical protein